MSEIEESNQNPVSNKQDNLSLVIYILLLFLFLPIPYIRHVISLSLSVLTNNASQISGIIGAIAQFILFGLFLLPLSLYWKNKDYRHIYRLWLVSSCLSLITLPIYWIKPLDDQMIVFLNICLIGIYLSILLFLNYRNKKSCNMEPSNQYRLASNPNLFENQKHRNLWFSILLISSLSYSPWLLTGALGSPFDSILQLILSLIIGSLSIFLIKKFILIPFQNNTNHFGKDFFLFGSASGFALLLIASACTFPYGGIQILLMIILPGLGWTLLALFFLFLNNSTRSRIPYIILVSLVASAPLVMIDADELLLILNSISGEILGKAIRSAIMSLCIIATSNIILIMLYKFQRQSDSVVHSKRKPSTLSFLVTVTIIVSIIFGGVLYFYFGQPGFYGEYVFVILKSQADINSASSISNFNERRQFVYKTLVNHANATQKVIKIQLESMGIPYKSYYLVNGFLIPNNPILRFWISTHNEVDRILENPRLRPLPDQLPISIGNEDVPQIPQWNLVSISAPQVWEEFGITGEGIVIGQSDSGVDGNHPELQDSYRGKGDRNDFNWYDPWNHTKSPNDRIGHGTHTLGTAVGNNVGVAPGAEWIACVNLARNLGNPASYLDCMQFMLAPFPQDGDPMTDGDPTKGAHVLNNSWGCPEIEGCDANTFLDAVRALHTAGIFFVAGAGNDGPNCNTLNDPPPIYEETFAVGAIDRSGIIASFSSIGPVTSDGSGRIKPELVAPGVDVLSSLPGNSYGSQSGTSMAGPHLVGVVALIWSANPNLIGDIEGTRQILIQSAKEYKGFIPYCPGATEIPSTATGYGIVDAYSAVKLALKTLIY